MAVNGIQIRVGQVWQTRDGGRYRVFNFDSHTDTGYVWVLKSTNGDGNHISVTQDGIYHVESGDHPWDLTSLVVDVQEVEVPQQPIDFAQADTPDMPDPDALAAETLQALGWHFNGQCWVQDKSADTLPDAVKEHPLYSVFTDAIQQAMYGKGERHGGAVTPFLEQPWVHYAQMHGRGFLTGQASKKLEEAASTRSGEGFETEMLGALVYAGMAVLKERGEMV